MSPNGWTIPFYDFTSCMVPITFHQECRLSFGVKLRKPGNIGNLKILFTALQLQIPKLNGVVYGLIKREQMLDGCC